ncbi:MAG: GNAT family N-acetyltransferase [Bacteroidales bacterium]|nr:GNAT family N-acetyltransferase [Bacteroidales bacterium]
MKISFRKIITENDIKRIRQIALSTGFFRDDEIDVAAELVEEAYSKGQEQSGYFFLFSMMENNTTGFVCFGPTPCTIGTYDLYWIVVDNNYRGNGTGKILMQQTEKELTAREARKLYIETSSTDKYLPTREFYIKCGYTEEARLKDFYSQGDDKVIYSKVLIRN